MRKKHRINESEYQLIKQSLLDLNITTKEQLEKETKKLHQTAIKYTLTSISIALLLCLVLTKFSVFIVLILMIFLSWLWSSNINSKHYFQRYLSELNEE